MTLLTIDLNLINHNVIKEYNRENLKWFIDVTCLLENQEPTFRGCDESYSSLNRCSYVEFLQLLKDYDPL
jgi:hypothetical protein